uniref:Uncharacterized protein n=1 Tax=Oryza meridionalis TaxID=40149 RepID=A0A0E0E0V6_9ORYZ
MQLRRRIGRKICMRVDHGNNYMWDGYGFMQPEEGGPDAGGRRGGAEGRTVARQRLGRRGGGSG